MYITLPSLLEMLYTKHIYGETLSLALACNGLLRFFALEAVMSDDTRLYDLLSA